MKCVLDEIKTSIVNFFLKPQGPLLYIYIYFKIPNNLFWLHTLEKKILFPYVYYVH